MPCNSDYLEPLHRERELQRTAKLYCWVLRQFGVSVTPSEQAAADNPYCRGDYVPHLCKLLHNLSPQVRETLMSDVHNPIHRDLAAWWDEHQRADQARELREQQAAEQKAARDRALAKLSPEDLQALGLKKEG